MGAGYQHTGVKSLGYASITVQSVNFSSGETTNEHFHSRTTCTAGLRRTRDGVVTVMISSVC